MNVLAVFPAHIPSTSIGIVTPLAYLERSQRLQFTCCLEREVTPKQVLGADVIITGRNTEPLYKPVYELALEHHIPIIFELDDDLLNIPPTDINAAHYNHPKRRAHLEWMLRSASLVRVYSPRLKQVVGAYNDRVEIVEPAIDWSLVPAALPDISLEPIHIVYATSRVIADPMFEQLLPDLQMLLDRHPDRVVLHLLGYHPPELRAYPNVVFGSFQQDYQSYFTEFTRFGYGIGLAPLLDGAFYLAKTNNKFREYAAAGAAGIYRDTSLYRDVEFGGVVHGETGLLVDGTPGSWLRAIETLMREPALLQAIRTNARRYAESRYHVHAVSQTMLRHLTAFPSPQPIQVDSLPRWWFTRDPQTETAATRVSRGFYQRFVPLALRLRLHALVQLLRRAAYGRHGMRS